MSDFWPIVGIFICCGFFTFWLMRFSFIAGKEAYKNKVKGDSTVPANEACWDDRQGNQWLIFIMPSGETYLYCNGQAVGIHGDTSVKLNVKRRW